MENNLQEPQYPSQEEINQIMADYDKSMREYHDEVDRKNNRIFKALTTVMGKTFVKRLKEYMEELESSNPIEIVRKTKGSYQEENYGIIKGAWVDQWENGGYEGDSFSGDVYVEVTKNRFIKFGYSL